MLLRKLPSLPRAAGSQRKCESRAGARQTQLTSSLSLSTVAQEGQVALQRKLQDITLPDFNENFKIKHVGKGNYELHRWHSAFSGDMGQLGWG